MKKVGKSIFLSWAIITLLSLGFLVMEEGAPAISISIDGENVEFNEDLGYPFLDENNRTLVPFRATLEQFGAVVSWDDVNSVAIAEKDRITVSVPIGEKYIIRDGVKEDINAPAQLRDGIVYLPIRAILEAFDAEVGWDALTRTIVVISREVCEEELIAPVLSSDISSGMTIGIFPRVELLSGVLSQTSWMETMGPRGEGNSYFRKLQEFFSDYKDHEAMKIAEELTRMGFAYDAPLNFILILGELPGLEKSIDYSTYLKYRAGGDGKLMRFRKALIDLSKESDFPAFFEEHRADYQRYVDDSIEGVDFPEMIKWIEDFYGWKEDKFNIVFAPAMFPGGGYGATHNKANGETIVYQVVREFGASNSEPELNYYGDYLKELSLHEWSHAFVNPTLEPYAHLMQKDGLYKLYEPVKEKMKNQAYSGAPTFYNELVVRAITCIGMEKLYGNNIEDLIKAEEENNGFYLTEYTVEQLKYYMNNRDDYENFRHFAPHLLDKYSEIYEELYKLPGN